jgi:hypothetical protein
MKSAIARVLRISHGTAGGVGRDKKCKVVPMDSVKTDREFRSSAPHIPNLGTRWS